MKKKKKDKSAAPQPRHAFEMEDGYGIWTSSDGHHVNGFTKVGDRIKPSPGRMAEVDSIHFDQEGVNELIDSVIRFAAAMNSKIAARQKDWWNRVIRDLGLEGQPEAARLVLKDGWITVRPEPKEDTKNEGSLSK